MFINETKYTPKHIMKNKTKTHSVTDVKQPKLIISNCDFNT